MVKLKHEVCNLSEGRWQKEIEETHHHNIIDPLRVQTFLSILTLCKTAAAVNPRYAHLRIIIAYSICRLHIAAMQSPRLLFVKLAARWIQRGLRFFFVAELGFPNVWYVIWVGKVPSWSGVSKGIRSTVF